MPLLAIIVTWLSYSLCLWLAALVLPGFEIKEGFKGAAGTAILLGILNALAAWLLFGVVDIEHYFGLGPVLSMVLQWLITAAMLFVADKLSDALTIRNFGMALLAAVVITVGSDLVDPLLFELLHETF